MIENKVQRSQSRPGVATQPTLDPDYTVGKYGNISSQINIKRQPTQSNILKCFFDQQNTSAGRVFLRFKHRKEVIFLE